MELSCSLDCQVVNSVQYVTRVREVDSTVKLLCQHCLSSVVGMAEQEDLERRKESLESSLLVSECRENSPTRYAKSFQKKSRFVNLKSVVKSGKIILPT